MDGERHGRVSLNVKMEQASVIGLKSKSSKQIDG